MQTHIKKIFILTLFIALVAPAVSFAADISFAADKNNFTPNEDFLAQVFLDTKDVTVNAMEGTVVFPPEFLQLKDIRDGNSAVNFWVERPHSTEGGKVSFSGITTGGISGHKIFLFGLVLEAKKIGTGLIILNDVQVLQNDGAGTKTPVTGTPFSFFISKDSNTAPADLTVTDTELPENFSPFIVSDSTVFDGKYFIVFSTVDKGTGIDHYEVRESPWFLLGFGGANVTTSSPYLLKDQTLGSKIYIKAIDKAGNERIVALSAQNKPVLPVLLEQLAILGILLIVCVFIIKKIWSKRIKSK